ncbi:hypothetical protein CWE07_05185 [Aliidiomarina maris]|uniref:Uncharacterized protein n=1 Tax=Aliidiomarina maris TaxID=531312 RepID=A0ABY0BT74_9GAMM|nr:hypothetical protein CWE07_05185 [Aliidiomarina maris]
MERMDARDKPTGMYLRRPQTLSAACCTKHASKARKQRVVFRGWGVERMDARDKPTGMYLRRPQTLSAACCKQRASNARKQSAKREV